MYSFVHVDDGFWQYVCTYGNVCMYTYVCMAMYVVELFAWFLYISSPW